MYQSDSKNADLTKADGMDRRWSSPNVNRYFLQRVELQKKKKRDPMQWETEEEERARFEKQRKLYKGK